MEDKVCLLVNVNITASMDSLEDTAKLTVTEAPPQSAIEVTDSVDIASRDAGKNTFVWAEAVVNVTSEGVVVEGATVEGHWTESTYLVVSGTTDANGSVFFQSSSVKNPSTGTAFTFIVDRVVIGGITYLIDTSGSAYWS